MVAETFDQARAAAQLVRVDYVRAKGSLRSGCGQGTPSVKPHRGANRTVLPAISPRFAAAAVKLDATYTTPDHAHAMMEPFASIAAVGRATR